MKIVKEAVKKIVEVAEHQGYITETRKWNLEKVKNGYGSYEKKFILIIRENKMRLYRFSKELTEEEMQMMQMDLSKAIKAIKEKINIGQPINLKEGELFYGDKLLCAVIDGEIIVHLFEERIDVDYEELSRYLEQLEG